MLCQYKCYTLIDIKFKEKKVMLGIRDKLPILNGRYPGHLNVIIFMSEEVYYEF